MGLSLPVLGVLWLLVQHEPVVLLTQNVFLIVAIVGLILYSMVHTRKDHNNTLAYTIAAVGALAGIYAVATIAAIRASPSGVVGSATR